MNIIIPLQTNELQKQQLEKLRAMFIQACNDLTPEVQKTGVWDRVTLHRNFYYMLREKYPELGSQMACNVVYAVSKVCRVVYQVAGIANKLDRKSNDFMPLFRFAANGPVYFDRHTLSFVSGGLSLFTMDGRMKFELKMPEQEITAMKSAKLLEVMLQQRAEGHFELNFELEAGASALPTTSPKDDMQLNPPDIHTKNKANKDMLISKKSHKTSNVNIPNYIHMETVS